MANFFEDNEDLQFYVNKGIDWAPLVEITEYNWRSPDGFRNVDDAVDFYKGILQLVGEFSAEQIAPHALEIDRDGVCFKDGHVSFPPLLQGIFDQIKGLELHGLCVPRELGGSNAPLLVYFLNSEVMGRADVSVMAHHSFHGGIAMALLMYSVHEGTTTVDRQNWRIAGTRFEKEIREIISGEAWGSMDITEPDAGSDMARLKARARLDENGVWRVTGQKIFITSGHAKYHVVIARTEDAKDPNDPFAGLAGLSLFLVPAFEDQPDGTRTRFAEFVGVEEKMGHHGSATTTIAFEDTPAQLIGQRGEGFKLMLLLMNNARVGVGFESIGLCEAAYRAAKAYAEERVSMGKPIGRHEMIADYLDEMRTDVQGLRALALHCAWHEEMSQKLRLRARYFHDTDSVASRQDAKMADHYAAVSRQATPLLKYLASEKAVEMARRAMQIHGGSGYIRETGVEKLMRDALVMPIYEGTSQIQSLMAMKDTLMGVMKNPQEFVRRAAQARWLSVSATDPIERRVARIESTAYRATQHLMQKVATDKMKSVSKKPMSTWTSEFFKNWNPKRDFAYAMLHAENLTRILADAAIARVLWKQARKFPERRELADRYTERADLRVRHHYQLITNGSSRILQELAGQGDADAARA